MGGIIGLWLIFFVLVVAPVVGVELYVLVWMCGPAIRRATRRVAEGWYEVVDRRAPPAAAGSQAAPYIIVKGEEPVMSVAEPSAAAETSSKKPEDAGHRWLG
jgi:hypothetical protein